MKDSRKRILLINSHFGMGGIESAMVNMANELCKYYDVDLLIYNPAGPMKERLDSRVNILKSCFALRAVGMSVGEAFRSRSLLIFLFRLFASVWAKLFDNRLPIWIATKLQSKLGEYDLAVAYRQEVDRHDIISGFVRVLNRCVKAKRKVAWIHYDATYFKGYHAFNYKYYSEVDKIIGVSKAVADAFAKMNPIISDKIDYCYNFIDSEMLAEKSNEPQGIAYPEGSFACFSACRLSKGKAIERTIKAIAPAMHKHKDIIWYIAGDGPQRESILSVIEAEGLSGRVVLLGNLANPYPYIKNADLFMLTSYHEAAPVVYMEAKCLGTSVFTTETLSSYEMLSDGAEDFVCENSDNGIQTRFEAIVNNRELLKQASQNINTKKFTNTQSLEKISEIIEA
ncbi:MAG: glycosyltransferase [Clostridia bacterium]|nr:glycosyltransferase [Clostridia bacterium]